LKIVLDSNVLMSAFGTRGLCDALFEACRKDHELFVSEFILDEIREHLRAKFKVPEERVAQIIHYLRDECTLIAPTDVPDDSCRDPDDLMVLGTAVAARADVIVTGDRDLLDLKRFQQIDIVSPRAMYERLRKANE
jgi:uncharacterized protein